MGAAIRLEREMPVAGQAGCATVIGLLLSVVGISIVLLLRSEGSRGGENEWVLYTVGGGFGLVGLLLVFLGIKMLLMMRLPETILEVDRMPVHVGEPFRLTVRQPGPIRLASLRVNLMCEQTTTREVRRAGRTRRDRDRRLIHQVNVLDLRDVAAGRGQHVVGHATVTVPADVRPADIEGHKAVVWRLEVWGRVRGWADFGHPFVIQVLDR